MSGADGEDTGPGRAMPGGDVFDSGRAVDRAGAGGPGWTESGAEGEEPIS